MARILFFAVLAMCLVAMIQCGPVAQTETTTSDPLAAMEAAAKGVADAVQEGWKSFTSDPAVNKVFTDVVRMVADGADAVRQQAEKVLPKTQ